MDILLRERLEKNCRVFSAEEEPETAALIRLILDEARNRKSFYKESIKGFLQALLVMAARISGPGQETSDEPEPERKENRLGVVQAACHALRTTQKTIDEIRMEVGFDTASTFNRNFKKLVKMSPQEWRKRKAEKADYNISIYKGW